jgi:peptidoglycan/xylan/chitin deacetylase (PgdA/CDA1 family)
MAWLNPVNLTESTSRVNRLQLLVTFDDGYRNNLLAAEILAKYRIPWTLFISTAAIGREKAIWTVELSLLLLHGEAVSIHLLEQEWPLSTRMERETAFQSIRYAMKSMPSTARVTVLEQIRCQFPDGETQRLLEKFPSMQMLTWDEVRQLSGTGVVIGSHGHLHEIHHHNQPKETRREELVKSKTEIETLLGKPCHAFAFPNGNYLEISPNELRMAGYRFGFTLQPMRINSKTDLMLIPRYDPPGALTKFIGRLI